MSECWSRRYEDNKLQLALFHSASGSRQIWLTGPSSQLVDGASRIRNAQFLRGDSVIETYSVDVFNRDGSVQIILRGSEAEYDAGVGAGERYKHSQFYWNLGYVRDIRFTDRAGNAVTTVNLPESISLGAMQLRDCMGKIAKAQK